MTCSVETPAEKQTLLFLGGPSCPLSLAELTVQVRDRAGLPPQIPQEAFGAGPSREGCVLGSRFLTLAALWRRGGEAIGLRSAI